MTILLYAFAGLLLIQTLFRLVWLIDILVCMLLLEVLLLFALYDVNGVMILLILTIIYVGVILLLVFIVSFLVDISVDRIYRFNVGGFYGVVIFCILAVSLLDAEYNWAFLSNSNSITDTIWAASRTEAAFLWGCVFILSTTNIVLVGMTMFSVLLGVLLSLNTRIYA